MKAAALRGALSDRARDGRLHVVDELRRRRQAVDQDGRRRARRGLASRARVLVVVDRDDEVTRLSLRNVAESTCSPSTSSTPTTCCVSDDVVFTKAAFDAFVARRRADGRRQPTRVQARQDAP